jgi:hypothetical protein
MIVAACFFIDDGEYPNIRSLNPTARTAFYWRCLSAMFASARETSACVSQTVVFTNGSPSEPACKSALAKTAFVDLPYHHRPPASVRRFSGAMYLIDALIWCANNLSDDDEILFLDPDCVITSDLAAIQRAISSHGLVAYDLTYPATREMNGASRKGLTEFAVRHGLMAPNSPIVRWLGGEFLGVRGDVARSLAPLISRISAANSAAISTDSLFLQTEEQFLSISISMYSRGFIDAGDEFVKRIWTTTHHRNYDPGDLSVPVWHLPSEKTRGIQRLFKYQQAGRALPTLDEHRKAALARILGLRGDWVREGAYIARRTARECKRLLAGQVQEFSTHA